MFPCFSYMRQLLTTALALVFSLSLHAQNEETMKLIYVFDPLCGWCYGFSPVIQEFVDNHPELELEVISGGMVVGDRVGPLADIAPYMRRAYKDVEDRTGVRFGKPYLDELFSEAKMIMNSEPASLALAVIKKEIEDPRKHLEFAGKVQKAIYFYGMHPEDLDGLSEIMSQYGLDKTTCLSLLKSELTKEATHAEFRRSDDLGVTGYPAVLAEQNGEIVRLLNGYAEINSLELRLEQVTEALNE